MLKFKKDFNVKIISLVVAVLFVFNSAVYGIDIPIKSHLRVPVGETNTYKRLTEAIKTWEEQETVGPSDLQEDKNHLLNGPFMVPGTGILYYVDEVLDKAEIEAVLQKWFSGAKNRSFERNKWDFLMQDYVYEKDNPNGFLIKLQSKDGEILGLAFFHKVDKFMFSMGGEMSVEDVATIYCFDLIEVSEEYRDKGLGQVLTAKVVERSINDPDSRIEDRVLLAEPATRGPHSSDEFFESIGASPIHIVQKSSLADLSEQSDEAKRDVHSRFDVEERGVYYRFFYREVAVKLLNKVKNSVVSERLNLFSEDEPDGLKAESEVILPVQLNLFEDQIVVMEQLRKNSVRGSL